MSAKGIKSHGTDDLPVGDEEVTTHQEAVPLPYLAGTRKTSCRWMDQATNMLTKKSKTQVGKK